MKLAFYFLLVFLNFSVLNAQEEEVADSEESSSYSRNIDFNIEGNITIDQSGEWCSADGERITLERTTSKYGIEYKGFNYTIPGQTLENPLIRKQPVQSLKTERFNFLNDETLQRLTSDYSLKINSTSKKVFTRCPSNLTS